MRIKNHQLSAFSDQQKPKPVLFFPGLTAEC